MPTKITIEGLAQMIQKDVVAMLATKTDLANLATKDDVRTIIDHLDVIDKRLDQIDRRLDHIEQVVLEDHLQRIQAIEHAIGLARVRAQNPA